MKILLLGATLALSQCQSLVDNNKPKQDGVTHTVPDAGSTFALLALGLSTLAWFRFRR